MHSTPTTRVGAFRIGAFAGTAFALCLAANAQLAAPSSITPELVLKTSHVTGKTSFMTGANGSGAILDRAGHALVSGDAFLAAHAHRFGVDDVAAQLLETRTTLDNIGFRTTTYRQLHRGVPVFSGQLKVHQNTQGNVIAANGDVYDIPDTLSTTPTLDVAAGEHAARANSLAPDGELEKVELVVVDPGWYGDRTIGARLAYQVIISKPMHAYRQAFFIDAHDGLVLDQWTMIHRVKDREVYDENYSGSLPGNPARFEGDPVYGDADVDQSYDYLGDTYDYFFYAFGHDGVDGQGMPMRATVHTATANCPNAYWNGYQTVYCDTIAVDDVIGHEIAHGVTEFSAGLIYQNQAGQLNESFSDVFGEMIDLYNSGSETAGASNGTPWLAHGSGPGTDGPNLMRGGSCSDVNNGYTEGYRWLMGEDAADFGDAIRDMWNPPCKGHPDSNNSELHRCSLGDSGGVHRGSAVTNHAFAMVTDGKSFNGYTVNAIGPIKSGAVWYRALTTYLTPGSDFQDAYWAFNQAATDLIGTFPNDPATGFASASMFTAGDAAEVNKALLAVELDQAGNCGQARDVLSSDPAPACGSPSVFFDEDFESGLGSWTLANSTSGVAYDWESATDLPYLRAGSAAYISNTPASPIGDETGTHSMTSPVISLPVGLNLPVLEFTHYMCSEREWDGGNVLISIDGDAFTPIDTWRYYHNGHNQFGGTSGAGNSNPKGGEPMFTGCGGRWGTSLVSLSEYGLDGADIRLRFEFGKDGYTGEQGWFVDDVRVYDCTAAADCNNNGVPDQVDHASPSGEVLGWSQPPATGSAYYNDVDADGSVSIRAQRIEVMHETRIERMRLWGGYYPGNTVSGGDFMFRLYTNSTGSYEPDVLVYSEPGVAVSRSATGRTAFGVDELLVEVTPSVTITLQPGNYWFMIYDDTSSDPDSFIWLGSAAETGFLRAAYSNQEPAVNWQWTSTHHLAFEIVSDSDGSYCHADVTTQGAGVGDPGYGEQDGSVTGADVQYYVNLWLASDGCADVTTTGAGAGDPGFGVPDGDVTGADIQFYINSWVAGCP